jgi:hypothetical protein
MLCDEIESCPPWGNLTSVVHPVIRWLFIVPAVAVFESCANTGAVLPLGPDTYATSASYNPAVGSTLVIAQQNALTKGQEYCHSLGREFLVVNTQENTGKFTATYRCLVAGDPELRRPAPQPVPTVVIENKRP